MAVPRNFLVSVSLFVAHEEVSGLDNGFLKPAMGWNPWNYFGVGRDGKKKFPEGKAGFDDSTVRSIADAMVSSGLAAVGYEYVNLDCGWTTGYRGKDNKQIVNTTRFPHGMKDLGDYIHSKGLKYGIYTSASVSQCCSKYYKDANDGSLDHEKIDAAVYAGFGVDYLKHDDCRQEQRSYPAMRDALNATGRHIVLSVHGISANVSANPGRLANSWRSTPDDNTDLISSLVPRAFLNNEYAANARPGQFNDADMLEVGNDVILHDVKGARTHFSLWCAMKSPLLIGTDITTLKPEALQILANPHAISVNQDPLGLQAFVVSASSKKMPSIGKAFPAVPLESVWAGPLSDGAFTALLLNVGKSTARITLTRQMLHKSMANAAPGTVPAPAAEFTMFDIWRKANIGSFKTAYSVEVEPHDVLFLRLTPVRESVAIV